MKRSFVTALCCLVSLGVFAERESTTTVIVQVSDPQMGFYTDNRDMIYETDALSRIVEAINRLHPDAVVFTGDYVHEADNDRQWTEFLRITARLDTRIRTAYIPGNHDVRITNGTVDTTPYEKHLGNDRFCFRLNGVLLTGINSVYLKDETADPSLVEQQFRWLEKKLASKRKHEVSILFTHHPFFLERIEEPAGYSTLAPDVRQRCFHLFEKYNVDALFSGHLHDNAEAAYRGIPTIVTGPAGRPLGAARSGVRIISIRNGEIRHRYFPIDALPSDRKDLE